jgi:Zn-dependent peptidase ImmA (M78 family)/transcriptional regulator with XRE-family HTH domain
MAKRVVARAQREPDLAYVNPKVISWALNRSALSRASVAERIGVDESTLESWEGPNAHPPFAKAETLAKVLHVPFGFFYLSTPPETDLPLPDFRGFDRSYRPSADLLEHLNDTLIKQDWFREYAKETTRPLKFVGSFTVNDSVDEVATSIRQHLGINQMLREAASNWSDYLSTLSKRAEAAGVLVMRSGVVGNSTHRQLQTGELLGFAVADQFAPVVFVNSADYKTSQVFTLAHELTHLWIGQTAIANPDELDENGRRNRVEAFCNKVAAEVLVPKSEFDAAWRAAKGSAEMRVQRVAKRFWVSTFVTLRRAHELGQVDEEEYATIRRNEFERRKKDVGGGGDYYRNILVRMSPRLTDAVLTQVNRGKIELRDAAQLLCMKVPTLVKFAEKWK